MQSWATALMLAAPSRRESKGGWAGSSLVPPVQIATQAFLRRVTLLGETWTWGLMISVHGRAASLARHEFAARRAAMSILGRE